MSIDTEFTKIMLENDMDNTLQEVKNAAKFKDEAPRTGGSFENVADTELTGVNSNYSPNSNSNMNRSIKKSLIAASIATLVIVTIVVASMQ